MIKVTLSIDGEVADFIKRVAELYGVSKESIICELIAKGYDPSGNIAGEDISIAAVKAPAMDKPAQTAQQH